MILGNILGTNDIKNEIRGLRAELKGESIDLEVGVEEEGFTNSIKNLFSKGDISNEINEITDEVKQGLEKLTNTMQISPDFFSEMSDQDIDEYIESLGIADVSFKKLVKNVRDGKVAINSSNDAMAAYAKTQKSVNTMTKLTTTSTKALNTAMKALSKIGWMLVISVAIELISKAIETISNSIPTTEKFIEKQNELIDKAKENIESYEEEISTLEDLQDSLRDARGDKSKLAEITGELNQTIGDTTGLLKGETSAWDTANQKIQDRIDRLKELKELEYQNKLEESKDLYSNRKISNDNGVDVTLDKVRSRVMSGSSQANTGYKSKVSSDEKSLNGLLVYIRDELEMTEEEFNDFKSDLQYQVDNGTVGKVYDWIIEKFAGENLDKGKIYSQLSHSADYGYQISADEFNNYFNGQVETLKEIFGDYISSHQELFSTDEVYSILDSLVDKGYSLDQIESSLKPLLDNEPLKQLVDDFYLSLEDESVDSEPILAQIEQYINKYKNIFPEYSEILDLFYSSLFKNTVRENVPKKIPTFEEVFNAESFSEQKEELLELARAGEITYEVLESTDEYRTLLDETGLSAKEVKGEIMSLLSATELLAAASKGTEPLIGAYEEYVEKGFVTAEILEGMADTYKELASWEDFKVTAGDPTKTKAEIQEVFNKLLTEWYIDQDILDGLTEENQEIHIANMEDDNIINARKATDKYLSNKVLFTEAADEYKRHLEAGKESYEDYIKNKGQLDEEYLTSIGNANAELFNLYGKYYSNDLQNYASLIENKMKLEARLAELKVDLAETFGKDFEYDATKNVVENLEANGLVAHGNNIAALESIIDALNYNEEKLAETESEINDILYVGLDSIMSMDFDGIGSGANSSSDTVFDHVETRLNHLNEELEKTKETAEDTFSDWGDRSNAYKTASTQIDQLIEAQKKAKARYQAEADKSGISNSDRQLVEKGDLSIIETLSDDDPRKKQIESYKEWYDKVKACDDAILQLEKDSKEWDRTFRAFRWETFDTLVDQISRLSEEAEYLIGLLAEEDLFDDSGNMTEYATATLGLHLSNIDTYKQLAKDQLEEIQTLQKEVASGGADQETIDRYNELIDAHRDNINAIKDEENAILDLISQGYELQIKSLQEIIDKKKESLNAEKD